MRKECVKWGCLYLYEEGVQMVLSRITDNVYSIRIVTSGISRKVK